MTKSALFGLVILLSTAAVAVSAQERIDCGRAYKSSLERLRHKQLSPERWAALSRQALRIYDACETDDLKDAKTLFESLDRTKD
jgi:hypothetical protein